MSHIMLTV